MHFGVSAPPFEDFFQPRTLAQAPFRRAAGLYSSANGLAQISGNWIGAPLAAAIGFRSFYAAAAVAVLCAALYAQVALRAGPSRGEA